MDTILDFIRVRQLNIAVAGLLTIVYFVYQYWHVIFRDKSDDDEIMDGRRTPRLSRSRSRSASRSRSRSGYTYKVVDSKQRRGRKSHRRCPDCSLRNFDD